MYAYFSDLHVDLLARGVLEPDEQLVGKTVTKYMPWWAFGFINRTYLVLATDKRVVLLDHRMAWFHQAQALKSVESIPWQNVQDLRVKGLFLQKKLALKGQTQAGPLSIAMKIPNQLFGLLAPMRGNMAGARQIASAFQGTRQMGAHAAPASLPPAYAPPGVFAPSQPPQAYEPPPSAAPPQSYGAPPQAYAAPPQLPAQNAPGYSSIPPVPPPLPQRSVAPIPPPPGYKPRSYQA
jgi:hypothetical protein